MPDIKIKSIYGKTLYVAEGAADIREAVRAARDDGANLSRANLYRANLSRVNLYGANLYRANLYRANLSRANLYGANLYGANLSRANLYRADLSGADLSRADLSGAKGLHPARCTELLMLLDQPGKIRAYKLVDEHGEGPFNGGIIYEIGQTYKVKDADTDPDSHCGSGINLATLPWCLNEWRKGYRVLVCEFKAKDIACIPTATDGKFRVYRCKVIRELDVSEIVNPPQED